MKVNLGFFVSKFIRLINRPALRDCHVHNTAHIGTGSNCINMTMGRYSYMGKNNSVTNASIGAFCSIASYCAIGGGGHAKNMISTSPLFVSGMNVFRKNFSEFIPDINKPVEIGNDVWIGENVFIIDGIKVGNGAIIGAHSVVTHDVPPYSIVAGVPARVINYRFSEKEIELLEQTQWWDKSDEIIRQMSVCFNSIENYKIFVNDKINQ